MSTTSTPILAFAVSSGRVSIAACICCLSHTARALGSVGATSALPALPPASSSSSPLVGAEPDPALPAGCERALCVSILTSARTTTSSTASPRSTRDVTTDQRYHGAGYCRPRVHGEPQAHARRHARDRKSVG